MKSEDMLKAISNIDEELIENAEEKKDNRPVSKNRQGRKILAWAGSIAAVLAICVLGAGILGGASSKSADDMQLSAPESQSSYYGLSDGRLVAADSSSNQKNDFDYEKQEDVPKKVGDTSLKTLSTYQNVKLIYRASLSVQTTEYSKTVESLKAATVAFGGYIEGSNEWNGNYTGGDAKNGTYTLRIPSENYKAFLDSVGDTCHVVSIKESVDDIGQEYFETEQRLETLKIKEARLQDLLKEAKNLSDIITLENELSSTEYEIDMFTTTLNRYDSLVGFSTITVSIQEVNKYDGSAYIKESFVSRLGRNLKNGLISAWENVEDFILWVGYNLIGIIVVAVIVIVVWKKHLISRLFRKIFNR